MDRHVRVRFAPSPTGPLHIGGVRTALYNYLFARHFGGDFILRIEDTDSQRFVAGSEQYINEALEWCGIRVDEGVQQGGPHAPYRQSERKEIYLKYAQELVAKGLAYYAFDTTEQLDQLRHNAEANGSAFAYNFAIRSKLQNSLSLDNSEVQQRIARGDKWVIRFKMPENENVVMHDLIRGQITVNTATLDDKVLYKSTDSLPTYHLANIVDDHLMDISHVIRGEEWLPSLPLHYLLYRAFGWTSTQPQFAHLPLLLKPQGQGKLSKRDGDRLGFPVFPLRWVDPSGEISSGYREEGYLPQAFINMLALLGWNPGTEQEMFDMSQLINEFALERVGKSGARFNPEKARWFNAQYLHRLSNSDLAADLLPMLEQNGIHTTSERAAAAIGLIKERATFTADLLPLTRSMFVAPTGYDEKAVNKFWKPDNVLRFKELVDLLKTFDAITVEQGEVAVRQWITEKQYPLGMLMNMLRIAVLGVGQGPSIFAICEFIGKDETLRRIELAFKLLGEGK